MIKPWMLPFFLGVLFYSPAVRSCPQNCSCNNTEMRCNIDDLRTLENINGDNITSLSLSRNKIRHIPPGIFKRFGQLQCLFLQENEIDQLANGSFAGLKGLEILNLENNLIYTISHEAFYPLHSLRQLNLRGNRYKRLPPSILFLPSLENLLLDDATDCQSCEMNFASNCFLDQRRKTRWVPSFGNVTGLCLSIKCFYNSSSTCRSNQMDKSDRNFTPDNVYNVSYHNVTHDNVSYCNVTHKNVSYHNVTHDNASYHVMHKNDSHYSITHDNVSYHHVTHDNISYDNDTNPSSTFTFLLAESVALKSFIIILGISTVLVNLITVVVVFTSSQLKRNSTIFLAGHIAVCDFFIKLFLFVAAVLELAHDHKGRRDINSSKKYICPVILSFRSAAPIVEPLVLFVMTLDRYKRIVHHSKPPLSRRFITLAAYFSWFPAVIAVSIGSIGFTRQVNYGSLCSRVDISRQSIDSYIERILIAFSAILFVTCCFMYFRIYRVVKSQNQLMGTQTYIRVCKLIFALVLSTMVLWYVPAIVVAFFGGQNTAHAKKDLEVRLLTILIAFTTNSLVNPILYPFREKQFRQQLCFFFLRNLRRPQSVRRVNPTRQGNDSFQSIEIPMADTKHEQLTSYCSVSEKTGKEASTSL